MINLQSTQKPIHQYSKKPATGSNLNTHGILYTKNAEPHSEIKGCMQFLKDNYFRTDGNVTQVKFKPANAGINNYNKEEIDRWLSFIKSNFNLKFEYDGEFFTISKDEVKSGFKMYITLILIRYLWYPCCNIIDETFRILETDSTIDPFSAVQIAHYNHYHNNPTFELFTSTSIFVPITTKQLLEDLEANEKGKIVTKTINYYLQIPTIINSGSSLKEYQMNFLFLFIARLLIMKYYKENNFSKILDVVNEVNSIYKVKVFKTNTIAYTNLTPLNEKIIKELIDSFLHTLISASISDIRFITNGSQEMIDLAKANPKDIHMVSSAGQYSIGLIEGFAEYSGTSYHTSLKNLLNPGVGLYKLYFSYFLIFKINE